MRLIALRPAMVHALFFAGVALLPLYLFSSGGMQVSHFLLGIAGALSFVSYPYRPTKRELILVGMFAFILLRESVATSTSAQAAGMLAALHFMFSLFLFVGVSSWLRQKHSWRVLSAALAVSVLLAIAGVLIIPSEVSSEEFGNRTIGTFNNPNQLGYFGLCAFSLGLVLYLKGALTRFGLLMVTAVCIFLVLSSLSKGSMLGIGIGTICMLIAVGPSRAQVVWFVLILSISLAAAGWIASTNIFDEHDVYIRLSQIGKSWDDSAEGRGYTVILDSTWKEVFFGFGAAKVISALGYEVHSTIFSFFINYGLLVGMAFVLFLAQWHWFLFRKFGMLIMISICAPPMLYGLTHNGSRFTIFWILLAASFQVASLAKERSLQKGIP